MRESAYHSDDNGAGAEEGDEEEEEADWEEMQIRKGRLTCDVH